MFTVRADVIRPLVAWLVDACGTGASGIESVAVRMGDDDVTLQNITAGNTIVITIVLPRTACTAWTAAASGAAAEHRLPLRPLKIVMDGGADEICIRLPSARTPDHFDVEMRTRGGGVLSSARVAALEAADAYFPVETLEFETALGATFQSRELCTSVGHARALGLEVTQVDATSDTTLELCSTATGSSAVDRYVVAFSSVDDPVLFAGGDAPDGGGDEDGDGPRVKRRPVVRVARIPNSILRLQCDRRIYKPMSFKIKFFERLLSRATFCSTVALAIVCSENGTLFRLDFTCEAAPSVRICAFVAPAIGKDD